MKWNFNPLANLFGHIMLVKGSFNLQTEFFFSPSIGHRLRLVRVSQLKIIQTEIGEFNKYWHYTDPLL